MEWIYIIVMILILCLIVFRKVSIWKMRSKEIDQIEFMSDEVNNYKNMLMEIIENNSALKDLKVNFFHVNKIPEEFTDRQVEYIKSRPLLPVVMNAELMQLQIMSWVVSGSLKSKKDLDSLKKKIDETGCPVNIIYDVSF